MLGEAIGGAEMDGSTDTLGSRVGVDVGAAEPGGEAETTGDADCTNVGSGVATTDEAAGDAVCDGSRAVHPARVVASASDAMRRNLGMVRSPADAIRMYRRVSASQRSAA
jgi:hypothetical protein